MKKLLLASLLALSAFSADLRFLVSAQAVTINNTTAVTIRAGLANTTNLQMYVRQSSTAQTVTLTLPDTTTIEIPSGGTLAFKFASNLNSGDIIGTVISGTGSCVLQVISTREVRQ